MKGGHELGVMTGGNPWTDVGSGLSFLAERYGNNCGLFHYQQLLRLKDFDRLLNIID